MNKLILTHTAFCETGIFGSLEDDNGPYPPLFQCFTLEHAYPFAETEASVVFKPKVPPGIYRCVRGVHHLKGAKSAFDTFEVTNVPGHTGILFHCGNTEGDSSGCILLGTVQIGNVELLKSREAFDQFMYFLDGVEEFELEIK